MKKLLKVAWLGLAVAGQFLWAQEDVRRTTIRSHTRLVEVPTVVTDKSGRPVLNLERGDFQLFENGKKVEISTFSASGQDQYPAVLSPGPAMPGVFTNAGAANDRPITILVIDATNTPFLAQMQARRELLRLLAEGIPPGTQFSLLMITKSGLRVLHEYTTDTEVLIEALKRVNQGSDAIESDTGSSLSRQGTISQDSVTALATSTSKRIMEDVLAGGFQFQDIRRSVSADLTLQCLRQIADHFSGVPGRKSLLWAAANFPFFGDDRTSINSTDIAGRYLNTFERLNNANIVIYPVDAAGLIQNRTPSLDETLRPPKNEGMQGPGAQILGGEGDTGLGRINEAPNRVDTMKTVADLTGGTAFYGSNDLAGMLRKAVGESDAYYTLGYYLADGVDAKPGRRELKVMVSRKDVKVRSRTRLIVTRETFTPREEINAALRSPMQAANLPLRVKWDAKSPESPFLLSVDPKTIELSEPLNRLDLTVVVEARTPEGNVVSQLDKRLSGNIAKLDEFLGRPFEYRDALAQFKSPATVRFVVRDNNSGRIGSVIVELPPPSQ